MEIYDAKKLNIITDYDLTKGYLKNDKITIHHPEVKEIQEQYHYEEKQVYHNSDGSVRGKDLIRVIDVKGVKGEKEYDEVKDILVYIPYTKEELLEIRKEELRDMRNYECFSILNQNFLVGEECVSWFDTLTEKQKKEASEWIQAWRDVTETLVVPERPIWLK